MKMGYLVSIVLFSLCANLPGVQALEPGRMKHILKEKAGLSDQQIKKFQDLQFEADKQRIDLRHAIQKAKLELQRLMQADKPEKTSVFKKLEQIGTLEISLRKNRIGLMLDIRAILSQEQWNKLESLQALRKMRRAEQKRARRGARRYDIPDEP